MTAISSCNSLLRDKRCQILAFPLLLLLLKIGVLTFVPGDSAKITTRKDLEDRKVNNILLLCYFRGGSTLTSELFSNHKDIFYSYEPLLPVVDQVAEYGQPFLTDMFDCKFNRIERKRLAEKISLSWRSRFFCGIWDFEKEKKCWHTPLPLLERNCKKHKIRVIKVIRVFNTSYVINLVKRVKVIHVVRDPRGMLSSMAHIKGRGSDKPMTLVCKICKSAVEDNLRMTNLPRNAGISYTLARYEDMVFSPRRAAGHLRQFAEVAQDASMKNWVRKLEMGLSQKSSGHNVFLTDRKYPKLTATAWKKEITSSDLKKVQSCCSEYIRHFRYEFVDGKSISDETKLGFKALPLE